jgi:hypothetical protein
MAEFFSADKAENECRTFRRDIFCLFLGFRPKIKAAYLKIRPFLRKTAENLLTSLIILFFRHLLYFCDDNINKFNFFAELKFYTTNSRRGCKKTVRKERGYKPAEK